MSQHIRLNLPGSLFIIDLTLDSETNTGKVVLERKAVEAQKVLSDLDPRSIQTVLLDLLEAQGLHPNPRIISRVLEDGIGSTEAGAPISTDQTPPPDTTYTVATVKKPTIDVKTVEKDHFLKIKDLLAATNSQVSKLGTLIGSSDMSAEVESTMKSLQNLLTQAKSVINDALSS